MNLNQVGRTATLIVKSIGLTMLVILTACSSVSLEQVKLKTVENDTSTQSNYMTDYTKCTYYVRSNGESKQSSSLFDKIETCLKLRGWTWTRGQSDSETRLNEAIQQRQKSLKTVSDKDTESLINELSKLEEVKKK